MKIHPQTKRRVEVVEFIGFPIVVSALLNVSAGPTAYWQAGVYALVCVACVLPMLFYFLAAKIVGDVEECSVIRQRPLFTWSPLDNRAHQLRYCRTLP
jgi:hypothetical protein